MWNSVDVSCWIDPEVHWDGSHSLSNVFLLYLAKIIIMNLEAHLCGACIFHVLTGI